jgi:hypothetical protein
MITVLAVIAILVVDLWIVDSNLKREEFTGKPTYYNLKGIVLANRKW